MRMKRCVMKMTLKMTHQAAIADFCHTVGPYRNALPCSVMS